MTGGWVSMTHRARPRARVAAVASGGLAIVIALVGVFGLWSARELETGADSALAATHLSDAYAHSAGAIAAEESLERKYRLEPGPDVRARFDAASAELLAALSEVHRQGDSGDKALVVVVRVAHTTYLLWIDRMFAAVDSGDTPAVLRIDGSEIDPAFETMSATVSGAAPKKELAAVDQLARLNRLENMTRWLAPAVLLVGLVVAAGLLSVIRSHRRMLDAERARAVDDSLHDALTGLPNRTLLTQRLEQALDTDAGGGPRTATALLLIDLDRFKEINDTFGHGYGDQLLLQLGQRLAGVVGERATVARLGGDEFAILVPDIGTVDSASAAARRVLAALRTPFRVEGVDLDVDASIGVVVSGEHGSDSTTLLQRVDVAMYVAKTEQIGVSAYDPIGDPHSPARLALLGELRRALDHGELVLHYQPKVRISDGALVGAEALVRWQHPERGLILPGDFVPLAEHTGLVTPLRHLVLDTALAQVRAWSDAGRRTTVSVNLSARNLLDPGLAAQVADLLAAHGVDPELLALEVTETAIMIEPARAQRVLRELAALGVRISLDDFGAGYTSLGQLRTLPISELKIDLSLVIPMTQEPGAALIVRSVVELGRSLGLTLVAEGVEDAATLDALALMGCDVAQGYHFSPALTADAFAAWCAGRPFNVALPVDVA
jgi:diguanylate cyclase (GGDEF)-like protein